MLSEKRFGDALNYPLPSFLPPCGGWPSAPSPTQRSASTADLQYSKSDNAMELSSGYRADEEGLLKVLPLSRSGGPRVKEKSREIIFVNVQIDAFLVGLLKKMEDWG